MPAEKSSRISKRVVVKMIKIFMVSKKCFLINILLVLKEIHNTKFNNSHNTKYIENLYTDLTMYFIQVVR